MRYFYILIGLLALVQNGRCMDDTEGEDSTEHGNKKFPGRVSTTCDCGWTNKFMQKVQRIVGGVETDINEYPMMAGLYYKPRKLLFCGGTIITAYHVLTAAHCTEPFEDEEYLQDMQVVLGEHDVIKIHESKATLFIDVLKIVPHPEYYLVGHLHDISIINLKKKIPFSVNLGPACMPRGRINLVGREVKVLGWGKVADRGRTSNVLMEVNLNVVPLKRCSLFYDYIDQKQRRQICTFHPQKDSCEGDSGGPLLHLDKETNRYVLVGTTSFGQQCASQAPAVSTNVTYYMPWIQDVVASTRPSAKLCTKEG